MDHSSKECTVNMANQLEGCSVPFLYRPNRRWIVLLKVLISGTPSDNHGFYTNTRRIDRLWRDATGRSCEPVGHLFFSESLAISPSSGLQLCRACPNGTGIWGAV